MLENVESEILQLISVERQLSVLKEREKNLKEKILGEMERTQDFKFDSPEIKISYVEPVLRKGFDAVRFQKENPEMYQNFVTFTKTKSSIRVTIKESEEC